MPRTLRLSLSPEEHEDAVSLRLKYPDRLRLYVRPIPELSFSNHPFIHVPFEDGTKETTVLKHSVAMRI